jgi:hypothetical protein
VIQTNPAPGQKVKKSATGVVLQIKVFRFSFCLAALAQRRSQLIKSARQNTTSIPNGQDLDTIRKHVVDDPVGPLDQLPDIVTLVVGHYSAGTRLLHQLPGAKGNPVNHSFRIQRLVLSDVVVDLAQPGPGAGRPH